MKYHLKKKLEKIKISAKEFLFGEKIALIYAFGNNYLFIIYLQTIIFNHLGKFVNYYNRYIVFQWHFILVTVGDMITGH